jgi:hypothetical protein
MIEAIEAIHTLWGAADAGRHFPDIIRFIEDYPGIGISIALVVLAGLVAAILIRRIPAEEPLSIR